MGPNSWSRCSNHCFQYRIRSDPVHHRISRERTVYRLNNRHDYGGFHCGCNRVFIDAYPVSNPCGEAEFSSLKETEFDQTNSRPELYESLTRGLMSFWRLELL